MYGSGPFGAPPFADVLWNNPAAADTGTGTASFTFDASAVGAADAIGSGSSSFSFTVSAVGSSDAIGSGAAEFSFSASANGVADATGSGAASFEFTAAGTLAGNDTASGSSSFSFLAGADATADAIGSGSSSFSFSANATSTADAIGSGSSSFSFSASGQSVQPVPPPAPVAPSPQGGGWPIGGDLVSLVLGKNLKRGKPKEYVSVISLGLRVSSRRIRKKKDTILTSENRLSEPRVRRKRRPEIPIEVLFEVDEEIAILELARRCNRNASV